MLFLRLSAGPGAMRSARRVAGPATPSTGSPLLRWNRRSAFSVAAPNTPSGDRPSAAWSDLTPPPRRARRALAKRVFGLLEEPRRRFLVGLSRLSTLPARMCSAARVCGPALPSTGRPCAFCHRRSAFSVVGPKSPSGERPSLACSARTPPRFAAFLTVRAFGLVGLLTRVTLGRSVVEVVAAIVSPAASGASAPCWRGSAGSSEAAGFSGAAFLGAAGLAAGCGEAFFEEALDSSTTKAAGSVAAAPPPLSLMALATATPATGPPVAIRIAARGTLRPPISVGRPRRCDAAARRARERSSDCSHGSREPRSLCKSNRLSSLHSACGVS